MKPTTKEIDKVLNSLDTTMIHKTAKLCGVDVSNRGELYDWIKSNTNSQKVLDKAGAISLFRNIEKNIHWSLKEVDKRSPIQKSVESARYYKKRKFDSYSKKLIEGNKNIYWASPVYGHSDYNKSIAFANNEKNRKAMVIINNYLGY